MAGSSLIERSLLVLFMTGMLGEQKTFRKI
jgi:hypothetical protein